MIRTVILMDVGPNFLGKWGTEAEGLVAHRGKRAGLYDKESQHSSLKASILS